MNKKYYLRTSEDISDYLDKIKVSYTPLSCDVANGKSTWLYSAYLESEEATLLKLKVSFVGFLDFTKVLGRQIKQT